MRPPHEVLGIAPAASAEEFHSAYRRKMRELHPDARGPLKPGEENSARTRRLNREYLEVQTAYAQYKKGQAALQGNPLDPDLAAATGQAQDLAKPFLLGLVGLGSTFLKKKTAAPTGAGVLRDIAGKGAAAGLDEAASKLNTFIGSMLNKKG